MTSEQEKALQDVEATIQRNSRRTVMTTAEAEVIAAQHREEDRQRVEREAGILAAAVIAGELRAFNFIGKVTTVGGLVKLKQAKESKSYRHISGIGSWEKYCEYIGLSSSKVNEDLQNLEVFGVEFLQTVGEFSLGYRDLRKLRHLKAEGALMIEDKGINFGGEIIPLDEEHKDELQAALDVYTEKFQKVNQRLEKLEKNKDEIVKEEVKALTSEKKHLQNEVDRLKAFDPGEHDTMWCVDQVKAIDAAVGHACLLISKFVIDDRLHDHLEIQAQVLGYLARCLTFVEDLQFNFMERYPRTDSHNR